MDLADENLRIGRARAGTIPHLFTKRRILGDVELDEGGFFARQQRLGGAAIAAARTGEEFDGSGHLALCVKKLQYYMGVLWVSTTRPQTSTSTYATFPRSGDSA